MLIMTDDADSDIVAVLENLLDQVVSRSACEDCAVINETVHYDSRIRKALCADCIRKRDEERERVLEDLQNLANEVEQRLEAIENTERELDQWRDAQLQKNRYFWDEYRRQVENFSACRIRTLQYEYRLRQSKNDTMLRRLKCAKYLAEHLDQFSPTLDQYFPPTFISLISSETFSNQFSSLLSFVNDSNSVATNALLDDGQEILEQLEQFTYLDRIAFLENGHPVDEHLTAQ